VSVLTVIGSPRDLGREGQDEGVGDAGALAAPP
jgi:hypothetical protein